MDVLSDLLRAVRLTGAIYFDIDAGDPWVGESPGTAAVAAAIMPAAEHVISFHVVLSGGCWATIIGSTAEPVRLEEGDIVIFPSGEPNVLSSAPGARGVPNPLAMYYSPVSEYLPFQVIEGGGGPERTRF